ncbi:hypothetical protein J2T58_001337 [Methanocalculus alkaliphilus]|nr:hypothetical protein [Methanocalculus alkaliphilus]
MVKKPKTESAVKSTVIHKDMNSQAREEFLNLVTADTSLSQIWKNTLIPLISESIPDDLTPLKDLIKGVPYVKAETTQH